MSRRRWIAGSVLLSLAAVASAVTSPLAGGRAECADVYGGRVCSWTTSRDGKVVEVGVTVPIASIQNAPPPSTGAMMWPPVAIATMAFAEPVRQQLGLTDASVHWEPGGHPPAAYMVPHFDLHFNLLPASERTAIDCADTTKPVTMPAAYALPDIPLPPPMASAMGVSTLVGLCVPQMGMHAMPEADVERKTALRGSVMVGYYRGRPIFIEPMLSRAMLLEKRSFDLPLPAIPGFRAQPTSFHARYDAAKAEYRFTLAGFPAME